ncbi:menaquinone biosynthesis protein, family [Candidatus Magnetoovum chiemensis]|nr:menaquinone biosynthesis protein, family [Candidatus Magnetoovum chiemensis]
MQRINRKDAYKLFTDTPLLDLGKMADERRESLHNQNTVTFIVDRNINYTNVCINKCSFCAFYRDKDSADAYILDEKQIINKVAETIQLGGTQILLQGGLNPDLKIAYYTSLLKTIKANFNINIHGFSPPEVCYIAERANISIKEALEILKASGLDSIPGGGAEILSDRVREKISPKKINASKWLEIMEAAHQLDMKTTATMMFGTMETIDDIIEHLDAVRTLQDKTGGFTAFIPWSFQPGNNELGRDRITASGIDYLRILSFSRIYLDNINNIQASWVTQGLKMAQVALRFGANDFGSTMLEENVVKAAGVSFKAAIDDIINSIKLAGFTPAKRNTYYNILDYY